MTAMGTIDLLVPIAEQLRRRAALHPRRVLLHHRGRDWTYAEILDAADGVAAWLAEHGIGAGERVGIALPNSAEYVAAYFGVHLSGACAVTLDVGQPGVELAYVMNHSHAAAAIFGAAPYGRLASAAIPLPSLTAALIATGTDGHSGGTIPGVRTTALADAMQRPAALSSAAALDAPAQIIYTSGTTGKPKGVVLSHRNLAFNTASIVASLSLQEQGSIFAILPFSYSYGNSLLLTHVSCGGRVVVASDFVFWNDVLDLMERQQASGFAGIPSSFAMLVNRSDFLRRSWSHLRYLTCAGGALPLPMVRNIREHLKEVSLYLMYGQTEASARLACLPAGDVERKFGSAGRAIPGVTLSICNEAGTPLPPGEIGEVVARGDNIMTGYWNDPEATSRVLRADGLHTGDMAHMDEEGYVFITGRGDDVIKSGGYRIGPQEIEDAILQVAGVAEVGVTGIPDDILGAVPAAFVVAREDDASLPGRIRAHLQTVLPRYKVPRDIHMVPALPRTSNGKLQRRKLREIGLVNTSGERPARAGS